MRLLLPVGKEVLLSIHASTLKRIGSIRVNYKKELNLIKTNSSVWVRGLHRESNCIRIVASYLNWWSGEDTMRQICKIYLLSIQFRMFLKNNKMMRREMNIKKMQYLVLEVMITVILILIRRIAIGQLRLVFWANKLGLVIIDRKKGLSLIITLNRRYNLVRITSIWLGDQKRKFHLIANLLGSSNVMN